MHDSFHCLNFDMTHGQCIVFRNVTPAFTVHIYNRSDFNWEEQQQSVHAMMVGQRMDHERGDIWATNFSTFHNFGREFGCWYCNAMCSVQCTLAAACNSTKFYCSNKFILMSVLLSFDSPTHKYKLPTDELWTTIVVHVHCACAFACNFWFTVHTLTFALTCISTVLCC